MGVVYDLLANQHSQSSPILSKRVGLAVLVTKVPGGIDPKWLPGSFSLFSILIHT